MKKRLTHKEKIFERRKGWGIYQHIYSFIHTHTYMYMYKYLYVYISFEL